MEIRQVGPGSGAPARSFWAVARTVYAHDPCWVPPLPFETRHTFDPRTNPALQDGRWNRWVAFQHDRPVGRIAAFAPPHRPGTGYFGFFESPDDQTVSGALVARAESWLAGLGCHDLFGPVAITPRDQVGLLVAGFDTPPTMLTPYNPPYYAALLAAAGYRPAVHLRAYGWSHEWRDPRDLERIAARAGRHSGVRLRSIDPARLQTDTRTIVSLINATLADAWHYDPITAAEADRMAHTLRPVLDPALTLLAEDTDGPCGVALAIPDLNWLWRAAGCRLWPLGWLRLLTGRRRIPQARVMALGVAARVRGTGATGRLIAGWMAAGTRRGYRYAELAQVFDDNLPMRRILDRMALPVVRRYAVYHRTLPPGGDRASH